MRYALILLFLVACKTAEPKTEAAIQKSLTLDEKIERSQATPSEKSEMKADNAAIRTTLGEQGQKISQQTKEIQRLEWYEDIFWQIVIGLGGLVAGAGLVWLKKS